VTLVEELSADAFAPFGRIVDTPRRPADSEGDPWRWWAEAAFLDAAPGRYAVGYLEVDDGRGGFDWAERHLESEELVVPVRGELLLYAGPPDQGSEPAPERFRVFRVRPGQAALLGKGVWHGAPLAAGGQATALVLLREGTGASDTELVRFAEVAVGGEA
jgi:ureidoglycolate lyase